MCISYSITIYLATKQMIRSHSLHTGSDYLELNWTPPEYLPEKYILHVQVQYGCSLKPHRKFKTDNNEYVMTNAQYLTSDRTSVRISNLRPRSVCTLYLLAMYNPASLDSGIAITGTTLDEGSSKGNSYLRNYCNNLSNRMCLSIYMMHVQHQ